MYCEQVLLSKRRSILPNSFVCERNDPTVCSVCFLSLAYACHVARSKARSRMILLCGSGSRPSRTGIEHCKHHQLLISTVTSGARAHLDDVFKTPCSLILQRGNTPTKPPNCVTTERRDFPKTVCHQEGSTFTILGEPTVHQTPQSHLHPLRGTGGGCV